MDTSKRNPLFPRSKSLDDDPSSLRLRLLIGVIGLAFPFILYVIAGFRPEKGLVLWAPLSSISAYYYTGSVSAFAGMLVALAFFLFSYQGYNNEFHKIDRVFAVIAASAALGVAFFPTKASDGLLPFNWWSPWMGFIHFTSAFILFSSFIVFSLFLFTKSSGKKSTGKKTRNGIFIFCGLAMAGCIVWIGINEFRHAPIVMPEALALEFFSISWFTKGRIDRTAVAATKRAVTNIVRLTRG